MADTIALGQPTVGDEELDAIRAVFDSGWLSGAGPTCQSFEARFAAEVSGTDHALATSNCGSALHLGLSVLGAGPGDEVVVGDYTFPATGHSVAWTGAKPVFADIRPDIWSADPASVEAAITPRTVGIIAVDVFGQPADYDELRAIADRHGLWLMEDAACSAGATYKGRQAGSLADIATFSFHGRKGITAGEGGALTTNDADLAAHARKLHTYGIAPAISREGSTDLPLPVFDEAGYNYRMSDLAAGVMLAQLDRLQTLLANRRRVAAWYGELLAAVEQVAAPVALDDREHPWQSYVVTLAPEVDRGAVAGYLRQHGVQCNFGTYASHLQPVYGFEGSLPVSADLFHRHLAIPMHANLTQSEVERVVATLKDALTAARSN
ncbi:aminotransferase class I/II-fold pyridoxal phosphate-dependent enzyme [Agromyces sp. CFH 90414]|uniref:Aminotransferase class I/II-fold pyridoxal phosphate-dependent enzyme n=1 Tax=Agromyces agglutinans TaxID=2662258 RepID=A0A6I2F8A7_9MICO|nr:DegT/DnrJ/EryC1/StrS family aminotransferase [Agromyces agglutinans]MRG60561.1 aminotransferase class I/II-fold pyridoxal phosphate-dependent enzyme [Agromyces agglutinans]